MDAKDAYARASKFKFGGGISLGYNNPAGYKPTTGDMFNNQTAMPPGVNPQGWFAMIRLQGTF